MSISRLLATLSLFYRYVSYKITTDHLCLTYTTSRAEWIAYAHHVRCVVTVIMERNTTSAGFVEHLVGVIFQWGPQVILLIRVQCTRTGSVWWEMLLNYTKLDRFQAFEHDVVLQCQAKKRCSYNNLCGTAEEIHKNKQTFIYIIFGVLVSILFPRLPLVHCEHSGHVHQINVKVDK